MDGTEGGLKRWSTRHRRRLGLRHFDLGTILESGHQWMVYSAAALHQKYLLNGRVRVGVRYVFSRMGKLYVPGPTTIKRIHHRAAWPTPLPLN